MATRQRRPILCYSLSHETVRGYRTLDLEISEMFPESINKKIEGTIDNKAGYGTPQAAEQLGVWFNYLRDLGHKVLFEPQWAHSSFTIRYQECHSAEYGDSYCSARIEDIGRGSYINIQNAAKLLRKIGKKVAKIDAERRGQDPRVDSRDLGNWILDNPTRVINALESFKARRVELCRGTNLSWVLATKDRPWLLSDTLLEQFNL
jgi:hypothetical protein